MGWAIHNQRAMILGLLGLLFAGLGAAALWNHRVPPAAPEPRAQPRALAVELDRFSARHERSATGERLSVSVRLRTSADAELPCYVFAVARNDHAQPKLWAIWPPQPPGPAITASGHFHGANPSSGHPLTLSSTWQRVNATIVDPSGGGSYETIVIYVLTADGRVLLSRPFRV